MNRAALDRRRFLQLVGATALTYPFLRALPSYAAGGTSDPIYLVLLFTGCGCVRYRWGAQGPAAAGMTAAVTSPLVFRETLSAFAKAGPQQQADLTKYVTVLDGLQVKAAGKGSHETGMAALWTGLDPLPSQASPGPSIDQVISKQLNAGTPIANVPLMVQSSADYQQRGVQTRMLYDSTGSFVDPYTSPSQALSVLFPGAAASTPSGPDKKTYIRQKVAAHINKDLAALQKRLCTDDRQQLQNVQDLWNQVLMQIQAANSAAAKCMTPSIGDAGSAGSGGTDPFPIYAQAMPNILAMTLACNLTRVASLQFSHALSPVTHTWLGSSQTQTHHQFSHNGPGWIGELGPDLYTKPSSPYPQPLVDIETWYAQQVANVAYTLSQFKTASGANLLDQTLICWGSEIDMGNAHNHDDTPFVLVGAAGGKVKTNQLVRFPMNLTNPQNNQAGIRSQNDLLVTLAQIMGVSSSQVQAGYGSNWSKFSAYVTGPIAEILA
jgi:hypothetical protein